MKNRKLKVHSIFVSLQGEGPLTGTPSVFLRLSGCNLRCSFCDTPEALNGGSEMPVDEIVEILSYKKENASNLVITGGEPLLQIAPLEELLNAIEGIFPTVEIETNGTLFPPDISWINFNVSPKTSNSGIPRERAIKPEILRKFADLKSIFKFVVEKEEDIKEIKEIMDPLGIDQQRIYLMPMASTPEELRNSAPFVASLAIKYGFRYSDRLHIRLSIP